VNIADIFASVRLNLETGAFEVDAQKMAVAAGGKAGQSFSAAFGSKLKAMAMPALGAALGAVTAAALTGANQLDAATRQLQADTGMTADEAKRAQGALAGMYRGNLQGFDAIGAAMAKVHNDLGLVGDAADAATEKFLKFSTATGIDAAQAVALLDDALDNWGLTAGDAQMVMDKVIVSHQKWGGEIDKNLVTLAKVAPAMRAANFSIDDGIALLGLFGAKGLDSERAAAAFAKALTKVKSPAELQALITDISNTPDPFERAAKAADLFGAKAGAQLANALGGVAISDFAISIDEAAGKTDEAAKAIESGFGAQFQLLMKNAGGALAEFGTQFGGLLMVAAAFGPKMIVAIGAGLGGLGAAIIPKITGQLLGAAGIQAWMTTGTKIGTLIGAAIGPAIAVAAIAVPVTIILEAQGPVADFLGLSGKQTGPAGTWSPKLGGPFKVPVPLEVVPGNEDAAAAAFRKYLQEMKAKGLEGLDYSEWKAAGRPAGEALITGVGDGIASGAALLVGAMDRAGVDAAIAFGKGATSAAADIASGGTTLMNAWLHPLDTARVKTLLAGALHAKALVDGLNAGDPALRAAAMQEAISILTYLDALKGPAFVAGQNVAWSVVKGLGKLADSLPPQLQAVLGPILKTQTDKILSIWPTYQQQVAKLAISPGTIKGNEDLAAAIKLLGGEADAVAGGISDAFKTKLSGAFEAASEKARKFFDTLHSRNQKAIDDARDLANAQIDAQISAIDATVQAARDALQETRDARQEAALRTDLASATDPAAQAAAQQALSDFLAGQRITEMENAARQKIDLLNSQKTANDDRATAQMTAEDARYKAQTTAFDKELSALRANLDKHPAAWSAMNTQILKLLDDAKVPYEAAGATVGKAFATGVKSGLGSLGNLIDFPVAGNAATTATPAPSFTAAVPFAPRAMPTVASGGAASGTLIVEHLSLDLGGDRVIDLLDQKLAYRRRP
jgi:hypothetical protein